MWFLSDVFIMPWCMIKIYVSRKEISIKQKKIELESLVKTEQFYCTNCCKHDCCGKLSYRSIVWSQNKFKRFERILKLYMFCTHTHTHTHTHTCKSKYFLFLLDYSHVQFFGLSIHSTINFESWDAFVLLATI